MPTRQAVTLLFSQQLRDLDTISADNQMNSTPWGRVVRVLRVMISTLVAWAIILLITVFAFLFGAVVLPHLQRHVLPGFRPGAASSAPDVAGAAAPLVAPRDATPPPTPPLPAMTIGKSVVRTERPATTIARSRGL